MTPDGRNEEREEELSIDLEDLPEEVQKVILTNLKRNREISELSNSTGPLGRLGLSSSTS